MDEQISKSLISKLKKLKVVQFEVFDNGFKKLSTTGRPNICLIFLFVSQRFLAKVILE